MAICCGAVLGLLLSWFIRDNHFKVIEESTFTALLTFIALVIIQISWDGSNTCVTIILSALLGSMLGVSFVVISKWLLIIAIVWILILTVLFFILNEKENKRVEMDKIMAAKAPDKIESPEEKKSS